MSGNSEDRNKQTHLQLNDPEKNPIDFNQEDEKIEVENKVEKSPETALKIKGKDSDIEEHFNSSAIPINKALNDSPK